MRLLSLLMMICTFISAPLHAQNNEQSGTSWRLVYENDAEGVLVAGSKQSLIAAIRNGKPVRVYFKSGRVEHAVDAMFITIFEGEAFAQIEAINSQRPSVDPPKVAFREVGQKWRMIVGTNGYFSALMDGNDPNERTMGARWFVQD